MQVSRFTDFTEPFVAGPSCIRPYPFNLDSGKSQLIVLEFLWYWINPILIYLQSQARTIFSDSKWNIIPSVIIKRVFILYTTSELKSVGVQSLFKKSDLFCWDFACQSLRRKSMMLISVPTADFALHWLLWTKCQGIRVDLPHRLRRQRSC